MNERSQYTKTYIAFAERLAIEKGLRWTDMREAVCASILEEGKPVTAYQLIAQLSFQKKKDIKPASVYRSLDALCQLGLVVKIESLNAFIVCAHPEVSHQHVFLVCRQCGLADELADHTVAKNLQMNAACQGFKIERQVLELQGLCQPCQS